MDFAFNPFDCNQVLVGKYTIQVNIFVKIQLV